MTEVTAEMIARGRGADPRRIAERRHAHRHVQAAREKLTSSGSGRRAYDMELLRLYAQRRKDALPSLTILSAALGFLAAQWTPIPILVTWMGFNIGVILFAYGLADKFLAIRATSVNVTRWARTFVVADTAQGVTWAIIILVAATTRNPSAATFILIAMPLVAVVNATATASIPAAVYGVLTPMTLTIVVILRPTSFVGNAWMLVAFALGAQLLFVDLARKLYASALQSLAFQAEKDDLIGELEQSQVSSDIARRRAEESNLAKSRFLATMSHELRTPLNAILGFSEVMQNELFGKHGVPAYKDYATDIHSSGEHLLMLINEILDLSRVEAGRYELQETPVDLQNVIEECRHLVTLRAGKKEIEIRHTRGDALPRLWADERALRQVVLNLLSNAIKFTPQGGTVTISLGWTEQGGQYFSIVDTGAGIPEHEIPTVMSSFGRGSLAHKTAEEGTGLGLPIVKGLVELHGGTFELKSKVREGTEVIVSLPSERAMTILPHMDITATEGPVRPSLVPVRSAA